MKWSLNIGRLFGIHVRVHLTFFLLLVWIGMQSAQAADPAAIVRDVGFVLALFACVVLHELGHALTARRFGVNTRDITLLPIGGVARLERMPENPREEFLVAIAGPAVNVVIAAALFVVIQVVGSVSLPGSFALGEGLFIGRLLSVNAALVLFNLIPAFPMDGGRVLRSLLALRFSYTKATSMAATLGQGIAFVLGFLGFFGNPFLILIGVFVWFGASQESSMAQMKAVLSRVPVRDAMISEFHRLQKDAPLSEAIEHVIASSQQDFPVVEGDEVVGMLGWSDLQKALQEEGRDTSVSAVMRTAFDTVEDSTSLSEAFERLQQSESRSMPVLRGGRLIGLLTMSNLGEYMAIQQALDRRRVGSGRGAVGPAQAGDGRRGRQPGGRRG
jgi:Zn-dependent protease